MNKNKANIMISKKMTTGMWIPGEVCFNPDLSLTDQRVFWLIKSFDRDERHCFLMNSELAELLHLSEQTISNSIATLIEFCYIEEREFIGSNRILIVNVEYGTLYQDMLEAFSCAYKKIYSKASVRYKNIYNEHSKKFIDSNKDINIKDINIKDYKYPDLRSGAASLRSGGSDVYQLYTPVAKQIFEFWNRLGKPFPQHAAAASTLFSTAMTKIDKLLAKGYTFEEISGAMSLYHKMLSTPQYYKLNKSYIGHFVSIADFFGFSIYLKDKMYENNIARNIKSWFEECIRGQSYLDKTYGRYIEDQYPVITDRFRYLWGQSDFNTYDLTPRDENCFRKAAVEFMVFFERYKSKIHFSRPEFEKPHLAVKYVFESIKMDAVDESRVIISTSWLCSRTTYAKRLPRYFVENSMMSRG